MTVSLAEATAAARRIQADVYPSMEDAVLLAGFVLAGDTERLRAALVNAEDTFADFELGLGLLGREKLAEAARIAREGCRAALAEVSP